MYLYQISISRGKNFSNVIMGIDANDIVKNAENEFFDSEGRDVMEKA